MLAFCIAPASCGLFLDTGGLAGSGGDNSAGEAGPEAGTKDDAPIARSDCGATGLPDLPKEGLVMWLRADEGVETTGNGLVTAWRDSTPKLKSGPANDARQGDAGAQPRLRSDVSGPSVVFDGNDVLELPPGLEDFRAGFGFFAAIWPTLDAQGSAGPLFSLGDAGTGSGCGRTPEIHLDNFGFHCRIEGQVVSADGVLDGQGWDTISVVHSGWGGQATCPGGVLMTLRRGGEVKGSGPILTLSRGLRAPAARVGRSTYYPDQFYSGKIGEVLVYSRAPDEAEVARVTAYLMSKWRRP